MDWSKARAEGRVGQSSYFMCFSCTAQFDLDLDRDIKRCPKCDSLNIRSAVGALGCSCPRCELGVFIEIWTGAIC